MFPKCESIEIIDLRSDGSLSLFVFLIIPHLGCYMSFFRMEVTSMMARHQPFQVMLKGEIYGHITVRVMKLRARSLKIFFFLFWDEATYR